MNPQTLWPRLQWTQSTPTLWIASWQPTHGRVIVYIHDHPGDAEVKALIGGAWYRAKASTMEAAIDDMRAQLRDAANLLLGVL